MNGNPLIRCLIASFFLLISFSSLAQQKIITGKVVDADTRQPLPSVSVGVKGSAVTIVSNAEGVFSVTVPSGNAVLEITNVGYAAQEVKVGNQTTLTISMANASKQLGEVVVVGYGTQRRKDITGAVASLKPEDFNRGVVTTPQQLMQGRIAGVNVTASSGKPGGANTIRVRGGTSITAGNDPLYVVDGVPLQLNNANRQSNIGTTALNVFNQEPVNPLNAINPADIMSIEVLKDASATAIYGSRGANGVIIVTTKKGRAGAVTTSYDTYAGVSAVAKTLQVLSAGEYRQFMKDNSITNFVDRGASTDWQKQIFRTAVSHNHNLAVSGGTENTSYRGSVGMISQQGIIKSSGIKNYTGRLNINHRALNNKLSIDMNLSGAIIDEDNAAISGDLGGEGGNVLKDALRFNPTFPVYETNGNFAQINQFIINPLSYTAQLEDFRTTKRALANLSATYNIFSFLSFNVNLGYTNEGIDVKAYIPRANPLGQGAGGVAVLQGSNHWSKLMENTLTFNKQLNKANRLNVIAGYSYQDFTDQGFRNRVSGFISDEFRYYNIGAASTREVISSYQEVNKLISFYSRANYNLLDKYLVTVTVRGDGSSRFGKDRKWGAFPSGSVAWRLSNEKFFPQNGFVNDLKLRAGYGITGNQEIGNLLSLETLGATNNTFIVGGSAITIVSPERYANPDLRWEQTAQLNIGTDFQFLNNRIYGTLDYYRKLTSNLLLSFAIPSPSVVSTQVANVGEVENKGIELALGGRILANKDFSWKADINISANRNKVVSLSNDQFSAKQILTTLAAGYGVTNVNTQIIIPGQPLGTFYGPRFIGLKSGVQQFEDINGNGTFSQTNDVTYLGNTQPRYVFGFSNAFNYKNFDLSFLIRGSQGAKVFNNTALDMHRTSLLPGQNVLVSAVKEGIARSENAIFSSRWIEDGSFIRLDNITLGYNPVLSRAGALRNLRFYLTAQNLFLSTGYTGLDPEVTGGRDYMTYPRSRTYMAGASVTF